ncbi:Spore germination protein gerPA/gerPF [Bacillus subtilis]|uniref:spore germination protein n=1 Tax=Bacillus TaxID=1386 RepID=UPI0006A8F12F|nr:MULTISPECIES: spore germination protein [Bacillus]AXC51851.1 spore germination protein [Bacillus spizizenii]MDF4200104.1 spore germination protein [Bacillus subtilis]MDF4218289.1 spore germination protein [Bacillus subtilis]MEC1540885.1 spore germination protein [Bacillus subtilis]OOE18843.1 spore germination protein [Bacillus subtilis]
MMKFPVYIHSISGNSVFNNGFAFSISPFSVSKETDGSGGNNTGLVFESNALSQTSFANHALHVTNAVQELLSKLLG